MNGLDQLVANLGRNLEMLKMTLGDFSDDDIMQRPCAGANHAAWQLGHLAVAETGMVNTISPGTMPVLPVGFAERFTPKTCVVDDPGAFGGKAELLSTLERTRQASIKWAKTLSDEQLMQATPERMRPFAPTVGDLLGAIAGHTMMHIGQIQVLRRKLGKPILF